MESRGELRRAYRRAIPQDEADKAFFNVARVLWDEDGAIARCAATLVKDGDAIYNRPGKLTSLIARQLSGQMRGMVVTSSKKIVKELNPMEGNVDVVMIGGNDHL